MRAHLLLVIFTSSLTSLIAETLTPPSTEITEKQHLVETTLVPSLPIPGKPQGPFTIEERMKELAVPGVSIALINQGKVEWTKGYGNLTQSEFLSQAGSASKIVTALTVLTLIDQCHRTAALHQPSGLVGGRMIDLDSNVRAIVGEELWKAIDPQHLSDGAGHQVTIRRLLSHTAGISAGGGLYYSVEAIDQHISYLFQEMENLNQKFLSALTQAEKDSCTSSLQLIRRQFEILRKIREEATRTPIASIDEILYGKSKQGPVTIKSLPGDHFEYSNFGYTLLQKVIETVTGKPFALVVQERVFTPLAMNDSTYLPSVSKTIHGNDENGNALLGLWRISPFPAAAGLWTTASDLAKMLIAIQSALNGDKTALISYEMAWEMIKVISGERSYGLGLIIECKENALYFGYSGTTVGFRNMLIANNKGQGAVIVTNSENGGAIHDEIIKSIVTIYDWPDKAKLNVCQPPLNPQEISSTPIVIADWAAKVQGTYGLWKNKEDKGKKAPDHTLFVHGENGKVLLEVDGGKAKEGGATIEIIPLGDRAACFRTAAFGPYKLCYFNQEESQFYLYIFGEKLSRIP